MKSFILCILFCMTMSGPVSILNAASDGATGDDPQPAQDSKTYGFAPVPAPFYTPETGWGGAASIIAYWNADRSAVRPDTASIVAIYTQKKQMLFAGNINKYLLGDRLLIKSGFGYNDWQNTFFGIGGQPPQGWGDDYEEDFIATTIKGKVGSALKLSEGIYAGIQWSYGDTDIEVIDEAGWLGMSDLRGLGGGKISGPGVTLVVDTRDEAFYPTRGLLFECEYSSYSSATGSTFDFDYALADFRWYHSIIRDHIIAMQLEYEFTDGDVPFYRLPSLANRGAMRGIEGGQYIDRLRYAFQAEYRFPLWRRFGGVLFGGAGQTATAQQELFDDVKLAGGFGLRYTIETNKHINARLDFGFDENGDTNFYFTIREAF